MNAHRDILNTVALGKRPSWDLLTQVPEFKALVGLEENREWHPEGTTDKHIDGQLDLIFNTMSFEDPEFQPLVLTSLFHDLYKSVCWSRDEKGLVHNYGHEKLASRYLWDFLAKAGGPVDVEEAELFLLVSRMIFWHMNKRTDFYGSTRAEFLVSSFSKLDWFDWLKTFYGIDSLSHKLDDGLLYQMDNLYRRVWGRIREGRKESSQKFSMVVGPSGSYKSTFARKMADHLYVSSDDIREELHGDASVQQDGDKVFALARKRVVEGLLRGQNVVMDATNLTFKRRAEFLRLLGRFNVRVAMHVFLTTFEACVKAQENRERKVPVDVIKRQYESLEMPAYCEADEIHFHTS